MAPDGNRPDRSALRDLVEEQRSRLAGAARPDGHFAFELEADATIPAEYVLLRHFLGEIDARREAGLARYLRRVQNADGSWPLFHDGAGNLSATVKAYWALKLIGDDPAAPHMARARAWVLARGGAAKANVFTRYSMALFGQIPWSGVPCIPAEAALMPPWFPFHLSKISYWSRTVLTPLLILYATRAIARNPTGRGIGELFSLPPERQRRWQVNPNGSAIGEVFLLLDAGLRRVETRVPRRIRDRALARAEAFVLEHLNGEHGLGAIYPAMANAVMALDVLGYTPDSPEMTAAREAIERLIVERDGEVFPQPCLSPVWDSALSAHALIEAGGRDDPAACRALDWLAGRQILDHAGEWTVRRPALRPGGWAFQYENPDYPDVDDTAVVVMAMHRADPGRYAANIARGCEWLAGMQSRSGGWGSFDAENEHHYLNAIPFADHGALLDPPTVDVSARCVGALAQVDAARWQAEIAAGVAFIRRAQEPDGSWFGRWGVNYLYGTWSALAGLTAAGVPCDAPEILRAVTWLERCQRPDGGWGETLESYDGGLPQSSPGPGSIPSQTAWALLGLMAAGRAESDAVALGIRWLAGAPREGPRWVEEHFTGTGFPRVFYLKYHGYAAIFPLWALARYRRLGDCAPALAPGI